MIDEKGCIGINSDVNLEELKQADLAIYLNSYEAGWASAGCLSKVTKRGKTRL
ncbi:MAG: hypothetical protein QW400_01815 [Candidatus Diapherotrites archaeon]